MKMGIEAGYGMDLTYRDINLCGEGLEPVGWQIPEVFLYGPQFFKHDGGHSAQDLGEVKTPHKMARSQMLPQNGFHVYTSLKFDYSCEERLVPMLWVDFFSYSSYNQAPTKSRCAVMRNIWRAQPDEEIAKCESNC
jgi:hypothetical protein